jgi:hypothetical protein
MRYLVIPLTAVLVVLTLLLIFILVMLLKGDVATLIDAFPFLAP